MWFVKDANFAIRGNLIQGKVYLNVSWPILLQLQQLSDLSHCWNCPEQAERQAKRLVNHRVQVALSNNRWHIEPLHQFLVDEQSSRGGQKVVPCCDHKSRENGILDRSLTWNRKAKASQQTSIFLPLATSCLACLWNVQVRYRRRRWLRCKWGVGYLPKILTRNVVFPIF